MITFICRDFCKIHLPQLEEREHCRLRTLGGRFPERPAGPHSLAVPQPRTRGPVGKRAGL